MVVILCFGLLGRVSIAHVPYLSKRFRFARLYNRCIIRIRHTETRLFPFIVVPYTHPHLSCPRAPYETEGIKPGIVFPTGVVEKDGLIHLYYGAADSAVGVARMPELLL